MWANSSSWYTAYPEDIKLYGLSWNAQLGTSGIAFQGEVSYRQDNPLQVDDVELEKIGGSPGPEKPDPAHSPSPAMASTESASVGSVPAVTSPPASRAT